MSRRKSFCHSTRQRVYRLTIAYVDARDRQLEVFRDEHMAGEPVRVSEKLFVKDGSVLRAPEVVLTMPKHDVQKTIVCQKCSTKRKSISRHDV